MPRRNDFQRGFTIVEMLVVAPVVILAIGAFLTVIISMTGEVISSRAANNLTFAVQDGLAKIEQDIKLSAGFLATNSVPLDVSDGQGINNDATNFVNVGGPSTTVLILNMVATTDNPTDANSRYVYLRNQPNPCASSDNNIPMTYNIVYFIENDTNTLWRRVIMPQNYADTTVYACDDAWQRPSCNPAWLAAQTGPTFCTTEDEKVAEGITAADFNVEYFTNSASQTPITNATDAGASLVTRTSALIAATTARVTIDAQQQAGGREVAATGTVRSTRLDLNASAIASLNPVTIPASPTVASTTISGARAVFTWPSVTGATGYTIEYNFNGGSWTTGFTNQNTRSLTVDAPANETVVNARVVAINSSGTSSQTTTAVTIPLWEPLLLQGSWSSFEGGFGRPSYTKTNQGIVLLEGMVKKSSAVVGGEVLATLPTGFRPSGQLMFGTASNSASARVDVQSTGAIEMETGTNAAWVSLDTIRFVAEGAITFTDVPTFTNSWSAFSPTLWQRPSYGLDGLGRVWLQGILSVGTITDNTPIFTLPTNMRPPQYQHHANRSSAFSLIGVSTTNVQAKGSGVNFLSMNGMFYPGSTGTWINMPTPLPNNWVAVGNGNSTAQYTISSDNIVSLKGLIRSGTTTAGTAVTTLPSGYRPRETLLYTTVSAGAFTRIDINTTGTVTVNTGASNAWLSLDNIHFKAEQ